MALQLGFEYLEYLWVQPWGGVRRQLAFFLTPEWLRALLGRVFTWLGCLLGVTMALQLGCEYLPLFWALW